MVHVKVLYEKVIRDIISLEETHTRTHLFLCGFYLNRLDHRKLLTNYGKKGVWKGHTSLSCSLNSSCKTPLSLVDSKENDGIQKGLVTLLKCHA